MFFFFFNSAPLDLKVIQKSMCDPSPFTYPTMWKELKNSIQCVSVSHEGRQPSSHQDLVKLHVHLVLGSKDF